MVMFAVVVIAIFMATMVFMVVVVLMTLLSLTLITFILTIYHGRRSGGFGFNCGVSNCWRRCYYLFASYTYHSSAGSY